MREGNYGNALQTAREPLSEESANGGKDYSENLRLIRLVQETEGIESERAMEELLALNAGLLRNLAYRFRDRGVDMEDLLQIGTIGMIKAARSFDCERGTCFSTYAVPMIIGEIRRYLRDNNSIRVSRSLKDTAYKASKIKEDLTKAGITCKSTYTSEVDGAIVEKINTALFRKLKKASHL